MKSGNFIGRNEAKDSARDGLGVEVACLRSDKEFMFFQRRRGLGIND